MPPSEAIELRKVPLVESYPPEDVLPEDGLYHYFLQQGEEHDDQRKTAMDRIWTKATYRLREVVEDSGNWIMYYLSNGPERAFLSEELMLIREDTELPKDYIQKRNIYTNGIDISQVVTKIHLESDWIWPKAGKSDSRVL